MGKINTVSVIDDDDIYTFAVKRIIGNSQVASKTIFFQNGKTALDFFVENLHIPENLPDLVLLDINMPVLDGWQFMDEFVKISHLLNKKITIYIVSSSIDEADRQKSKSYKEVAGYIVKPVTSTDLLHITASMD